VFLIFLCLFLHPFFINFFVSYLLLTSVCFFLCLVLLPFSFFSANLSLFIPFFPYFLIFIFFLLFKDCLSFFEIHLRQNLVEEQLVLLDGRWVHREACSNEQSCTQGKQSPVTEAGFRTTKPSDPYLRVASGIGL
jgi:hypothetical protein